jgi:hypothetical protein
MGRRAHSTGRRETRQDGSKADGLFDITGGLRRSEPPIRGTTSSLLGLLDVAAVSGPLAPPTRA